jgi:hypothetical protein
MNLYLYGEFHQLGDSDNDDGATGNAREKVKGVDAGEAPKAFTATAVTV